MAFLNFTFCCLGLRGSCLFPPHKALNSWTLLPFLSSNWGTQFVSSPPSCKPCQGQQQHWYSSLHHDFLQSLKFSRCVICFPSFHRCHFFPKSFAPILTQTATFSASARSFLAVCQLTTKPGPPSLGFIMVAFHFQVLIFICLNRCGYGAVTNNSNISTT